MLARMYARWGERRGFKVKLIDESPGEEAGIKSATFEIEGDNAYGWLKTEAGVHRLVRISPFDSNARRHTSFASVTVYPVIDDTIDIEINPSDVDISFARSSGAGGQHVNRTESAVRLVHKPSGIVIFAQEQRSQHQNKDIAFKRLKARLYDLELKKREAKANADQAAKTDIGWGHQIRSYVLQPYQLVKDLRTGAQSTNPGRGPGRRYRSVHRSGTVAAHQGRRRSGRGGRLGIGEIVSADSASRPAHVAKCGLAFGRARGCKVPSSARTSTTARERCLVRPGGKPGRRRCRPALCRRLPVVVETAACDLHASKWGL